VNRPTDNCGFATAIRMIEGKWKVDILCGLGTAPRRFGRLRQSISGISEKMLAQQLRELEADGLVERKVYRESPAKVVYSLTKSGAALNAGAAALCRWGEQFGTPADAQTRTSSVAANAPDDVMS
jgi:DNA-binding HxlR family transcriptional regulator